MVSRAVRSSWRTRLKGEPRIDDGTAVSGEREEGSGFGRLMNPSEHDGGVRRRTVDASHTSHTSHASHPIDASRVSRASHASSVRPRSSSASPTLSPRRRFVSDGPSRIQVRASTGAGAASGNSGMTTNAMSVNPNRNPLGNTNQNNPPGSPSAFSQHSMPLSPLSHQSSLNPTMAADLKKWVQNEEHLVPNHDVDEDEHHILEKLNKGESSLWDELFPDDDRFMSELEMEESRRMQDQAKGWREWLCSRSRRRFLKSRVFISWAVIGVLQIAAVVLGICNLVYGPYSLVWEFQSWRLCFLLALLPFTWIFGDFFVWLVIKFVERFLFTFPNCLYFTYACKGPLRWVMRFLALTILWACMMTINTDRQLQKVNEVYDIILKVIGCITLFCTANLLKRLAAKSLALNLNKGKNQVCFFAVGAAVVVVAIELMTRRVSSMVAKGLDHRRHPLGYKRTNEQTTHRGTNASSRSSSWRRRFVRRRFCGSSSDREKSHRASSRRHSGPWATSGRPR